MTKTIAAGMSVLMTAAAFGQTVQRPPAVPLIACDPYFSVWSFNNELTAGPTRHWTGRQQRLTSLVRVDGKTFRIMGDAPGNLPAAYQTGLTVLPTKTTYAFEANGVELALSFMTPLLPDDLMIASRPVTYVTWTATSKAGTHDVAVYLDATGELAVNVPEQKVVATRGQSGDLTTLRVGTVDQPVLEARGDDQRIDWGHFYLAAMTKHAALNPAAASREAFAKDGTATQSQLDQPTAGGTPAQDANVLAMAFPLGSVGAEAKSARAILAYDDVYSIRYFNNDLKGYWTRDGTTFDQLLVKADKEYDAIAKRAAAFDDELVADMKKIGGESYVQLGVLAYRHSLAAQKICADANGQPIMMSKENFSNGCIATVDVLYPASPLMIAFSPNMMKASLRPLLDYSSSPRWKHDSAPHDMGTYPQATGQVYGGGDSDSGMPVEETGNMLCMLAGLARAEGNAEFSKPYWPMLTKWATYLKDNGFDPGDQLTTDDFAGRIARNTNLSAKAIEGVASYALLADLLGKADEAKQWKAIAHAAAEKWTTMAADGDHYALVFGDRGKGTWSQKYNLVWDKLLGLNVFPPEVAQKELAFYMTKMNKYGLPLDSRKQYTKLDWELWTATLADKREEFQTIVDACAKWTNETPDRAPMGDWYQTINARKEGFQARSVVGGLFIPFLKDGAMWRKYASRDQTELKDWAPVDYARPHVKTIVAAADTEPAMWRYATSTSGGDEWTKSDFDDKPWKSGKGGFGVHGTPGEKLNTRWDTDDLYLRRDFTLPAGQVSKSARLWIHHDDDAEVYVNGVLAARLGGFVAEYVAVRISEAAMATLKPGRNTIAIHCHQTGGGQYVDAGLVELVGK